MNEEHTKKLIELFPWMDNIPYGIGVGDGWYDLIYTLCANIDQGIKYDNECIQRYKDNPEGFTWKPNDTLLEYPKVDQIKEKFGGLRFYCSTPVGSRYEFRGMIQLAESISFTICEDCGNKGTQNKQGHIRTLCDNCRNKS